MGVNALKASLAQHILLDDSAEVALLGGTFTVTDETPNSISYRHSSRIGTGGGADEFSSSLVFATLPDSRTQAIVSIDTWREKDGVTRRKGIAAMTDFMAKVEAAVRAAAPRVVVDMKD